MNHLLTVRNVLYICKYRLCIYHIYHVFLTHTILTTYLPYSTISIAGCHRSEHGASAGASNSTRIDLWIRHHPFSNTTSETLDSTRLSQNIDTKHQPKIYSCIFWGLCDRRSFHFCSRRGGIRPCQRQQTSTGGCWKVTWKSLGRWTSITYNDLSSWWLNQPIWKNMSQIGFIFPNFRYENQKTFELPLLSYWCQWWPIDIIILRVFP